MALQLRQEQAMVEAASTKIPRLDKTKVHLWGCLNQTGGSFDWKLFSQKEEDTIALSSTIKSKSIEFFEINFFRLYVFGGKDIGLGHLNNLWMIDVNGLDNFKQGETEY